MKILLIGGQSALAQVLRPVLATFAEVVTAGRSGCDVALDLTWPAERFMIPVGVDVAINLAAHFGGELPSDFLAAEEVNTLGALKLCLALHRARVGRVLQISSINACLESTSRYYGIYALSKRQSDEVLQLFCTANGMSYAILRPSQLYGTQDGFRKHQFFFYSSLDKVLKNEDIIIYGRHGALRNYLHAEDLSRIIAAAVREQIEGVYQCIAPEDVGLDGLARELISASGSSSKVIFDGSRADIPDNVFRFDDTLYRRLGIYPEIGIQTGVARVVASRQTRS